MNRKMLCLRALVGLLVLLMAVPSWTLAQNSRTAAAFSQEELDQMLAPIALYPDSLLGQILVAATFPNEVVEADQWVRQNELIKGDELNTAMDRRDWDLSVKALVPFPRVLSMMSDKMDWTQRLGDAFLTQQADVMDTIQTLRAKAHAQGNLNSTNEQTVIVKGDSIEIQPANPRVIYVPAYNPTSVYGSWGHPAHPPYSYSPYYPGYVYDQSYAVPGLITGGLFGFAAGIAVGSAWNWGWGRWDWGHRGHRHMRVNSVRTFNINRDYRRRDIRTTDLHRVVNQRRAHVRRAELRAAGAEDAQTRSTTRSIQRKRQQRESAAQVRQGRSTRNGSQTRMDADRGRVSRDTTSSRKSRAQVKKSNSSSKKSGAQVSRTKRSKQSRGNSLHNDGSGRRGGNSHSDDSARSANRSD
jgi:hypothetical protein